MGLNSDTYFYHGSVRKIVSIFGSFFNEIYTGRRRDDGTLANMSKVPLSYGPRAKFLSRIREREALSTEESQIAIKLPRMSFEILSMDYDIQSVMNRMNRRKFAIQGTDSEVEAVWQSVPYNMNIELNILSRTQDDALQILEQILPTFSPEYTVSVKDLEGPGTVTDTPFVLTGVELTDDYQGEYLERRPIVYTLIFQTKVKFISTVERKKVIQRAIANVNDIDNEGFYSKTVNDGVTPNDFVSSVDPADRYRITIDPAGDTEIGYVVGESVVGNNTGHSGIVQSVSANSVVVNSLDQLMLINENLIGETSGANYKIVGIELVLF